MSALEVLLSINLVMFVVGQVADFFLRRANTKLFDTLAERQENLDKRLSLLLEASELQHLMISSDRDDIERLMKAFSAPRN